ncbi:hypothetical protein LguiA_004712 [Lonicera macranthoides]
MPTLLRKKSKIESTQIPKTQPPFVFHFTKPTPTYPFNSPSITIVTPPKV